MINQTEFVDFLLKSGICFFTGVPDSFLHGFCCELRRRFAEDQNVVAANEGNAVGVAVGHYLATGQVPLVYMQNSGLGNAVNPLASLACEGMLGIPMILLIGWRGDPWHDDHVQHRLQGKITPEMLDIMGIPYRVVADEFFDAVSWAVSGAKERGGPVALLASKGVLSGKKTLSEDLSYPLSREEAIKCVLDAVPGNTLFSATTGRAARELFHVREARGEGHAQDYLNVGSMGHASSVALGLALAKPDRKVVCLDGDAAIIMHMGSLAIIGSYNVPNYLHIALNNGAHESVGGQPSVGQQINLTGIARDCGYATVKYPVSTREEICDAVSVLLEDLKPAFLDIRIRSGIRSDMPPLDVNPKKMRDELMENVCFEKRAK